MENISYILSKALEMGLSEDVLCEQLKSDLHTKPNINKEWIKQAVNEVPLFKGFLKKILHI